MYKILYLISCIGLTVDVWAQYVAKDSIYKNVNLKEVTICKSDTNHNEAFSFYRSSKLIGTEDILSRIEGVNLVKRGAFGMEPTLRVYSAGQINLTINGMKMYGACTDKMDPVSIYIEPANLNKVEVTQGSAGNSMGSNIGGHINFQLKEPVFNCHNLISATVFSQYATNNKGINEGVMVNVNNTKFAVRLNATFRKANDYYRGDNQLVLYSGFHKVNMNMAIAYKLNERNLLLAEYIYDKGWDIGYPALTMDVSKAYAHIFSLTFRNQFKYVKNAHLESKIYYNAITHFMDDTKRPETIIHMDMPGWSHTLGAFSQFDYQLRRQQFVIRADMHGAYTRADMTMYPANEKTMFMQTLPGNNLLNTGISGQYKIKMGHYFLAEALIRIDYYHQHCIDSFGILQWSGMGFMVDVPIQNVLSNASTTLSYQREKYTAALTIGFGERLPTANERYGFYLYNRSDGYDYLGNVLLKPEIAKQIELKQVFTIRKVKLSATVFYHHINQYINAYVLDGYSQMTIGAKGVKTYENIHSADVTGFESTLSFKALTYFTYMANARYTLGKLSSEIPMQQVPPLKFIQTIRFQYLATQLQFEHIASAAQNRINTSFGEQQTGSWNMFNIRFAYGKVIRKSLWQLNIAVENIVDLNYREHLNWGNIPQPGRNLLVGINYYFN